MSTLKKPDLSDPKLRAKLAKGMGHNYYGEPAWPNDLLYIFPVVILGTIACVVGLAVLDPAMLGDKANPFATPLEILPEWYLYPVFQILRVVPNKLLGIALQTLIPLGLMILPFIENVNKFSNPFRRPVVKAVAFVVSESIVVESTRTTWLLKVENTPESPSLNPWITGKKRRSLLVYEIRRDFILDMLLVNDSRTGVCKMLIS